MIPISIVALIIAVNALGGGDDAPSTADPGQLSATTEETTSAAEASADAAEAEAAAAAEAEAAAAAEAEAAAAAEAEAAAAAAATLVVTAQQLIDELEANPLAAANNYEGKRVTVTGTLSNIDASGDYFTLTGTEDFTFTNVQFFIDETHLDTVAGFTTGQQVTATGEVTSVGEILGYSIDTETIG